MLVHATCVAWSSGKRWRAALLRGPSGAGKSDLALRLIDTGGRLVADDQTEVARIGRTLVATSPPTLAGMIEVRGIGIVKLHRGQLLVRAPVVLLVDLVTADQIERLPDPAQETLHDVELPRLDLAPFEASSVAKLRLALARIGIA
ncbi:MAG: HPr kinase/phosphatase C-terminal domain-containing protein [Enhydrobacter sp.]|nr:HPr kinase/phosphatase C-terminal domain-containing protein [Enhydrobacter sp.]